MVMFSPGQRNRKIHTTLSTLIVAEPWGEIWRGEHDDWGRVLVVGYKRAPGRRIFELARPALEQWNELAEAEPEFLKIHRIVAKGKVPLVLLEDPGGKTAREFFSAETSVVKQSARMARGCAHALARAKAHGLAPIHLSPDTIVQAPADKDSPWRMIPVMPGLFRCEMPLGDGRCLPPELPPKPLQPGELNIDTWALCWIWVEAMKRDFDLEHHPASLEALVPFTRLRAIVESNLRFEEGRYGDPKMLKTAISDWLKFEADLDRRECEEAVDSEKEDRVREAKARPPKPKVPEKQRATPPTPRPPKRPAGEKKSLPAIPLAIGALALALITIGALTLPDMLDREAKRGDASEASAPDRKDSVASAQAPAGESATGTQPKPPPPTVPFSRPPVVSEKSVEDYSETGRVTRLRGPIALPEGANQALGFVVGEYLQTEIGFYIESAGDEHFIRALPRYENVADRRAFYAWHAAFFNDAGTLLSAVESNGYVNAGAARTDPAAEIRVPRQLLKKITNFEAVLYEDLAPVGATAQTIDPELHRTTQQPAPLERGSAVHGFVALKILPPSGFGLERDLIEAGDPLRLQAEMFIGEQTVSVPDEGAFEVKTIKFGGKLHNAGRMTQHYALHAGVFDKEGSLLGTFARTGAVYPGRRETLPYGDVHLPQAMIDRAVRYQCALYASEREIGKPEPVGLRRPAPLDDSQVAAGPPRSVEALIERYRSAHRRGDHRALMNLFYFAGTPPQVLGAEMMFARTALEEEIRDIRYKPLEAEGPFREPGPGGVDYVPNMEIEGVMEVEHESGTRVYRVGRHEGVFYIASIRPVGPEDAGAQTPEDRETRQILQSAERLLARSAERQREGDAAEALSLAQQALNLLLDRFPEDHPLVVEAKQRIGAANREIALARAPKLTPTPTPTPKPEATPGVKPLSTFGSDQPEDAVSRTVGRLIGKGGGPEAEDATEDEDEPDAAATSAPEEGPPSAEPMPRFAGIMGLIFLFYIFPCACLQEIAKKTETSGAMLAWIPVANLLLLVRIADKPAWWFFPALLGIPLIFVLPTICEARGKSQLWTIPMLLPPLTWVALGYLAFSD